MDSFKRASLHRVSFLLSVQHLDSEILSEQPNDWLPFIVECHSSGSFDLTFRVNTITLRFSLRAIACAVASHFARTTNVIPGLSYNTMHRVTMAKNDKGRHAARVRRSLIRCVGSTQTATREVLDLPRIIH